MWSWGGGAFHSDDWGLSWNQDENFVDWLAAAVDDATLVNRPAGEPVSCSTNSGDNFTATSTEGVGALALLAAGGCCFATGDAGMLRSCDGGNFWEDMSEGVPTLDPYIRSPPEVLASDSTYVYGFFGAQLYRHAIDW